VRQLVVAALLGLAAVPLYAQTTAEHRGLAEEMRAVRGAIERIEKGQTALLLLIRIQIEESRLAALDAERRQLTARQQVLERDNAKAIRSRAASSGPAPTVMMADGSLADARQDQESAGRHDEIARQLTAVRQERQRVEEAIRLLRERIGVWESRLDPSLR
jgi:hypothetical protein